MMFLNINLLTLLLNLLLTVLSLMVTGVTWNIPFNSPTVNSLAVPSNAIKLNAPNLGTLTGLEKVSRRGVKYWWFGGLRYAQPADRFEECELNTEFLTDYDATQESKTCIQFGLNTADMSEDCLYLSISTPLLPTVENPSPRLPVLFFIYGGLYFIGNSRSDYYNPEHLVSQGVVVVQINYRLATMGFMTDRKHVPANLGIKDAIVALKWVNRYIEDFGGDPGQVTINGESAGAVICSHIIQSPLVQGQNLFNKAILQSGNLLNPSSMQPHPEKIYNKIARRAGCLKTSSLDTFNCLKTVKANKLITSGTFTTAYDGFFMVTLMGGYQFAVVLEDPSDPNAAVTKPPHLTLLQGDIPRDIKILTGINNEEMGLFRPVMELLRIHGDANPALIIPENFNTTQEVLRKEVSVKIKNNYLRHKLYLTAKSTEILTLSSDIGFNVPSREFTRLVKDHINATYCYYFTYSSNLGLSNLMMPGLNKVQHFDDMFYLWDVHQLSQEPAKRKLGLIEAHVDVVRDQMLRMWANFIKFGNPTPVDDPLLQNYRWPVVGSQDACLDLGIKLQTVYKVEEAGYLFWKGLYNNYGNDGTTY